MSQQEFSKNDKSFLYQKLYSDIENINETMKILNEMINIQGETITNIEDFINDTKNKVIDGNKDIENAAEYDSKFKKLLLLIPFTGAFLGFKFFLLGGGISYLLYKKL